MQSYVFAYCAEMRCFSNDHRIKTVSSQKDFQLSPSALHCVSGRDICVVAAASALTADLHKHEGHT